jgi:hypothetical protein
MIKAHIDRLNSFSIEGWAVSEQNHDIIVEVMIADQVIATAVPAIERPDVKRALGLTGSGVYAGFLIEFPCPLKDDQLLCHVVLRISETKDRTAIDTVSITDRLFGGGDQIMSAAPWIDAAPFPKCVADMLTTFWPEKFRSAEFDEQLQDRAVDSIAFLLSRSNPERFAGLVRYLRFLSACWAHFGFVEEWFPRFNLMSAPGSKDWVVRATHKREMISIANHLYCLRSRGLEGSFVEFGCFKGYSTCMLSYACDLLGIDMHVLDSFSGLPTSTSTHYNAGEFAGSLSEVVQNVELYGVASRVKFHPGYFHETLSSWTIPTLLSIWMDVDLEVSSKDAMLALPKVVPCGAVFSHECKPSNFEPSGIVCPRTPNDVIPPIIDAFGSDGASVQGCFLWGYTGAFWRQGRGVPVLANEVLMRLVRLA